MATAFRFRFYMREDKPAEMLYRQLAERDVPAAARKQTEMPGTAPDVGGLLRLKAAAPIKPAKPQRACDHGLFSDEADQLDLCEMFQDQPEDGL